VKRLLGLAILFFSASIALLAQSSLSDDSRALKALTVPVPIEGGPVWVTVVSDKTANVLWRDAPAGESIHSDALSSGLVLYAMGVATKDFVLTPEYSIEQDGKTFAGKAINIRNLSGGPVERGETLLGLVAFSDKIDLTRAFTLDFAGSRVEVKFNPDDVKQWGALSRAAQQGSAPQAPK
jgi:hypothetical protein